MTLRENLCFSLIKVFKTIDASAETILGLEHSFGGGGDKTEKKLEHNWKSVFREAAKEMLLSQCSELKKKKLLLSIA